MTPGVGVNLAAYDNGWYQPGPFWKRALWLAFGERLVRSWLPSSGMRTRLLRVFGATVGTGVVIKPGVRVKYPWFLTVGDHTWIGEDCWIDNLTTVRIGSNVCLSQGAYLCTGNHDWTDPAFGLRTAPILCMDGSWAGAKSVLGSGNNPWRLRRCCRGRGGKRHCAGLRDLCREPGDVCTPARPEAQCADS